MSALHATAAAASVSSSSSSPAVFRHRNDFLVSGDDDALKREGSNERYALVMTNAATMDVALAKRFWDRCEYRICADGGANRLFDGLSAEDRVRYVPDAVKGDLDSVRADVRAFYRSAINACCFRLVVKRRRLDDSINPITHCVQRTWLRGGARRRPGLQRPGQVPASRQRTVANAAPE